MSHFKYQLKQTTIIIKLRKLFKKLDMEVANNNEKFIIKKWNAVTMWRWEGEIDTCAICQNHLMDNCISCQSNMEDNNEERARSGAVFPRYQLRSPGGPAAC